MKLAALTFAAALAASSAAFAASPFVGSWTMDAAKSNFTGDTMTYTKTANGYHLVNGPTAFDFAIDGKPYSEMVGAWTVAWTKSADGGWDLVYVSNGQIRTKAHRTLSADGSTLTTSYEEHRPDGTVAHESDVYSRVGGGTGLVGTWKSTKVEAAPDALTISPAAADSLKFYYPAHKLTFVTKVDGSSSPVTGPALPADAATSFEKAEGGGLAYTQTVKGKVFMRGVMTVSADGSTLTDTSWAPGKEDEKSVEVYDRQ